MAHRAILGLASADLSFPFLFSQSIMSTIKKLSFLFPKCTFYLEFLLGKPPLSITAFLVSSHPLKLYCLTASLVKSFPHPLPGPYSHYTPLNRCRLVESQHLHRYFREAATTWFHFVTIITVDIWASSLTSVNLIFVFVNWGYNGAEFWSYIGMIGIQAKVGPLSFSEIVFSIGGDIYHQILHFWEEILCHLLHPSPIPSFIKRQRWECSNEPSHSTKCQTPF